MDGEANGTQAQGEEQQGQSVEQKAGNQQPQQQAQEVGAGAVGADGAEKGAGNVGGKGAGSGVGAGGGKDSTGANDGNGSAGISGAASGEDEYRAALADRDAKIAELEAQIAEASKSVESAEALAKQIEGLKAAADEERVGFELKLAGVRNVTAAKAVLGEYGGDVAKLKAAMPWMFEDAPAPGGTTGLEPAGAASGGDDELKRWYRIAGIEDKE